MSEDCSCCVVWSESEVEFFAGGEITGDAQELLSVMTAKIQSEFNECFMKNYSRRRVEGAVRRKWVISKIKKARRRQASRRALPGA